MASLERSEGLAVRTPATLDSEIRSVGRALDLLCCFSSARPEWGVTEMAAYLGLSKSVVHRLFRTLESYAFVERMTSRRYRLGSKTLELGNTFRFDRSMLVRAEPALRRLADESQSVAHLAQLDGRDTLELLRSSATGAVMFSPYPVQRCSAHATALGKVLLAGAGAQGFQQWVGIRMKLPKLTPRTVTDPRALWSELETVARSGYAVSDEETKPGCRCVAVPVRDSSARVVAAISVSNTVQKFSESFLPMLLPRLEAAARSIERQI